MSEDQATATCYRWSRDFVVAHAVFASGFVTAPVAVLHLLKRPHSWRALLFAVFAALCTTISLVLCFRFYAELKRPPWPSPPARGGGQQPDAAGRQQESARDDDLRRPETMVRVEMQAALASGRVPSYAHGDGAADCAVCLGEVENGEMVRRMPACQHVFHRECIDLWLRGHATCPVCRSGVLSEVVLTIDAATNGPA
jgi:hypothetical protein